MDEKLKTTNSGYFHQSIDRLALLLVLFIQPIFASISCFACGSKYKLKHTIYNNKFDTPVSIAFENILAYEMENGFLNFPFGFFVMNGK